MRRWEGGDGRAGGWVEGWAGQSDVSGIREGVVVVIKCMWVYLMVESAIHVAMISNDFHAALPPPASAIPKSAQITKAQQATILLLTTMILCRSTSCHSCKPSSPTTAQRQTPTRPLSVKKKKITTRGNRTKRTCRNRSTRRKVTR